MSRSAASFSGQLVSSRITLIRPTRARHSRVTTSRPAIGTCTEEAIVRAMRLTWERMKIVVEASSAVPLACLLEGTLALRDARVGIVLSGGNVDLDALPWQHAGGAPADVPARGR